MRVRISGVVLVLLVVSCGASAAIAQKNPKDTRSGYDRSARAK
jgi:hypothetical protein